ncbi:MAG: hypothetical protein EKK48_08040 [Candidatus Melainabacteria bacterium]|nr:MAG: hypothetical protein EKK48_08040 [Candidatus Melainabacteria bacterium]
MRTHTYILHNGSIVVPAGRSDFVTTNYQQQIELPTTNRIANNKRMAPCLANVFSALVGHSTRRSLVYLVDDGS